MTACYGPTNPAPGDERLHGISRYLELVELNASDEQRYREMHAEVWPEIVAAIRRAHISNYSIFITTLGEKRVIVRYFEYTGNDPQRDFATIAEDPTVRDKWWPLTDNMQVRLPGTPDGQHWLEGERVMWLP
jgi:L-rhamnose mutarotase